MLNKTKSTVFAVMLAAILPLQLHAEGNHKPLKVALWGDEFYNSDPIVKAQLIEQTINSMNSHNLDFTIFAGDT